MKRGKIGYPCSLLQSVQEALIDRVPGRGHRQEMGFVDDHQMIVLKQDLFLKRNFKFVFNFTKIKNYDSWPIGSVCFDGSLTVTYFLPGDSGQPDIVPNLGEAFA
jgi:hypothetical protein